jgi:hypothetical protein
MADFRPFAAFDRNGLAADIAFACPGHASWSSDLARAAFELTRTNMRALYEAAPGWGWREGAKRAEMAHEEGRYLVARAAAPAAAAAAGAGAAGEGGGEGSGGVGGGGSGSGAGGGAGGAKDGAAATCKPGDLLGFVSFRFLAEGEYDVLYIYELQMGPQAQRRGLGKHLVQLCELIARKCGMQWCVPCAPPEAWCAALCSMLTALSHTPTHTHHPPRARLAAYSSQCLKTIQTPWTFTLAR